MNLYQSISIIITLATLISYLNYRFVKMQPSLAVMLTSLCISIGLLIFDSSGHHFIHNEITTFVNNLQFEKILMDCMLGLLLFAGALTIDIAHLRKQKVEILLLSTLGVVISTFIIGYSVYFLLHILNIPIALIHCLLFGALISPTDPVLVLSTLKQLKAQKKIELLISAESLFNDGVGLVLFVTFYYIAFSGKQPSFASISLLFLHKTIGGILFGLFLSYIAAYLMKSIDDHKIEIMITIALVTGGYSLAHAIGVSGPLAMIIAGIFISNHKREIILSKSTRQHLENFWELVDSLLNAILFLLLGFEILLVPFSINQLVITISAIPLVLLARYFIVALPFLSARIRKSYPSYTISLLAWSGLRGGLAVALALIIPEGKISHILLPMTYAVVLFSILGQGPILVPLIRRCNSKLNEKGGNTNG